MKWYKSCPLCNQGRLFVMRDSTNERLYLHCEECEWGFRNPADVYVGGPMFLTLLEEFDAAPATEEEIRRDLAFCDLHLVDVPPGS